MNAEERAERRRRLRFPCNIELRGKELAPLGIRPSGTTAEIRGRTYDISDGGVCLLSKQSVAESSLLRCELSICEIRAAIPTLMQVRWTQRIPTADGYKIGLQFIL